jgi:hypothetical protein
VPSSSSSSSKIVALQDRSRVEAAAVPSPGARIGDTKGEDLDERMGTGGGEGWEEQAGTGSDATWLIYVLIKLTGVRTRSERRT